MKYQSMMWPSK